MASTINRSHVEQYKARVEMLLQQKRSRFEDAVMRETFTGKAATVIEQVGAVTAVEKTVRHADTAIVDVPHNRPWIYPRDFPFAAFIDREDKMRALVNFENPYADSLVAALQRQKDDLIIAAAHATVNQGENGTDTDPFSATYSVASGTVGLTVAKLIQASEDLNQIENDPDEPRYCAISARQLRDLLNDVQVTSADYNTVRALVAGEVDTFMGFKFIRSQRLATVAAERACITWVKSGICLGLWDDVSVEIDRRPDKAYLTQVFVSMTAGAVRVQQGKVGRILCVE